MRLAALAAGLALLLAPTADGATTCLTDPFTLDDQRALAALRVTTDATCPCDAFAQHRAYQRCARGVSDAAVASAALRRDCVRTARDVAKGASCSTSPLVNGDPAVTCSPRARLAGLRGRLAQPSRYGEFLAHAPVG